MPDPKDEKVNRTERVFASVYFQQKVAIEQAAAALGLSLSDLVITALIAYLADKTGPDGQSLAVPTYSQIMTDIYGIHFDLTDYKRRNQA